MIKIPFIILGICLNNKLTNAKNTKSTATIDIVITLLIKTFINYITSQQVYPKK